LHFSPGSGLLAFATSVGAVFLVLLVFDFIPARAHQAPPAAKLRIMTWGTNNTPEWKNILHLSGFREGCSDSPQSCMRSLAAFSHDPNIRIFLAIRLDPKTAASYGQQYSALSLQNPSLEEISLDDFAGQYQKLFHQRVADPAAVVNSLIDGLKSRNHNLHFGITLYEDELTSDYLSDSKFPKSLRARVDNIHLFLHYASDAPNYRTYVNAMKSYFPNAGVIAGVYAYDRITYLPCGPSSSQLCTPQQEKDYFTQSLDTAVQLLQQEEVSWIEFYPGEFGREAQWGGWHEPRACTQKIEDCVNLTLQLRQIVADRFKKLFG